MSAPILWGPNSTSSNLQNQIKLANGQIIANNGPINYIKYNSADSGLTGWATYANTAQSTPVNGTGGIPSVTWTSSTSSPLRGTASFLFTKDAVNRQGQGVSYGFSIDSADQGTVQTLTFDYIVASGTFVAGTNTVDSDVTVWIYDVTNSVLIQPSTYTLQASSTAVPTQFQAQFQTSINSTSYRFILHCATTSALAYTLKFDNFELSPSNYVYGSPVTAESKSQTITIGAITSAPTKGTTTQDSVTYHREGQFAVITYKFAQSAGSGNAGSGDYLFSLPSGLVADTGLTGTYTGANIYSQSQLGVSTSNGSITSTTGPVAGSIGPAVMYDSTRFRIIANAWFSNGNNAMSSGLYPLTQAIGFGFTIKVPILGWSSNVQMSDQTTTRVVAFSASSATTAITGPTQLSFNTPYIDTHNAATTNTYVIPVPGAYKITNELYGNFGGASSLGTAIYLNGSQIKLLYAGSSTAGQNLNPSCSIIKTLKAGDIISWYAVASAGTATIGDSTLSIARISGPSQIAASETIAASYYCSVNFAASTTTPINYDSREFDTHGAVTTSATSWRFTAPISGLYQLGGMFLFSGSAVNTVYKNGVAYKNLGHSNTTLSIRGSIPGILIQLNAQDYIDFRPSASVTVTGGTLNGIDTANINIVRVGNRG